MVRYQEQEREEKLEEWEIGGDIVRRPLNPGKEKQKPQLEKF